MTKNLDLLIPLEEHLAGVLGIVLEELQEDMLWSGGDDETAAIQPPVQRLEPSGAASRIITARRSSSGRASPIAPPQADARPRSPPPQLSSQPPQATKPPTPDAGAAETASPRRTSSMRAMFSRRSRSSRRQEG